MAARCGELITADEARVVTKPPFDATVVDDGQNDGGFANSTGTD